MIWVSGDDFLDLPNNPSVELVTETITAVVGKVTSVVAQLSELGLSEFLVFGLPDFCLLPANAASPKTAAQGSFLSGSYNTALQGGLASLNLALPTVNVNFFDVKGFFDEVINDCPARAGLGALSGRSGRVRSRTNELCPL